MHAGWRAQDSASEPSTPRALGRRGKEPVLGDGKTGAQAQLLSSNCAKQHLRKHNKSGGERGQRAVSGKEDSAVSPLRGLSAL